MMLSFWDEMNPLFQFPGGDYKVDEIWLVKTPIVMVLPTGESVSSGIKLVPNYLVVDSDLLRQQGSLNAKFKRSDGVEFSITIKPKEDASPKTPETYGVQGCGIPPTI